MAEHQPVDLKKLRQLGKRARAVGFEEYGEGMLNAAERIAALESALAAKEEELRGCEREALERAAKVAENVRGGYSAAIRTSESEQEFVRDPDGPWVLNSDIARAIRALTAAQQKESNRDFTG